MTKVKPFNLEKINIENRIGISTHFMPSTHGEDIIKAIELTHKAGFKGFELVPSLDQAQLGFPSNHPNVGVDLFEISDNEFEQLRDALKVFDWVTIHSPHLDWNLSSVNRHLRKLTWKYYDACLEFAARIGAIAMTYHGGVQTNGYIRENRIINDYNVEYAKHAVDYAQEHNVPIGYEAGSLNNLKYVCDQVEGWGINLDIGHAYMSGGSDENFFAYIDKLGNRIVEIHHNGINHYWGKYMEHQPPHLNNMIDFKGTYSRLKEIGYSGPIVCEIQGNDIKQVIKHCLESKEMIVRIWGGTHKLIDRWNILDE
ncbi:sugar phosphate isomerase/epimerase [Candidatus Bathyarchaeota archaeon]|nr:sugar phosphate isomerase/epimerase [Candidatus Bathyarchaeota archaeon]